MLLQEILTIFHVLLCIGLIGLILIQHGKGADAGAAFGSGASGTVFGSQGSASFLTRTTAVLAATFFVTCLILAYFSIQRIEPKSIVENVPTTTEPSEVPATPTSELPPTEGTVTSETDAEVPSPASDETQN
jgi:preprotein translocase subunit SecG